MNALLPYVGIDVSKTHLDGEVIPAGEMFHHANTPAGIAKIVTRLATLAPDRIVLEATGGYEAALADALWAAGLPVVVMNPRCIRQFAQSIGALAKTDGIDAHVLAQYAFCIKPTVRPLPSGEQRELQALLSRRHQLVTMRVMEVNRQQQAPKFLQASHRTLIDGIQAEIKAIDRQIEERIRQNAEWRRKAEWLDEIRGIGFTTAALLVGEMPEIGTLNRGQTAKLAGLAPLNNDSGRHKGERHIWGGRAPVRAGLYMATLSAIQWNPTIKAFYERLLSKGKLKMVALTACMRKLLLICNAVVRQRTPWVGDPQTA